MRRFRSLEERLGNLGTVANELQQECQPWAQSDHCYKDLACHGLFCGKLQVAPKTSELLGMSPKTHLELPAFSVTIIATSSDDTSAAAAA